ncbi:hypothetical protein KXX24_003584 [Aspergillus fumigatus]|nr:hypothetical protein KXX66_003673 [Aspergillus fumigatus]KAH1460860.1 hypothetical protein KXX53_004108 [Aspergillus fumigatus]KAH1669922.1 hypothetical protein KXX46_003517 [Aspergillus fumigatus]KAH1692724.1 hypothetical protein KXX24_003584 [Aspergillus fumigatus]KAH2593979.1 hypothetical protein KXW34_003163 [Aspergillus fumigatus]
MRHPRLAALGLRIYPWKDYQDFRHQTPAQRHAYIIGRVESARRREWMWIVIIFSVNMVLPIINIVYWNHSNWTESNAVRHDYEVALSIVTLGGVLLGQIAFGFAADVWGRSKVYGMELVILIFPTLGLALSSSGAENSMSAISLFLFWRGLLGIGLGGDYPVGSYLFAPSRLRGRLLATVFFCQSLGQLAAQLIALIAMAGFQHHIPTNPDTITCTETCVRSLDTIWRLLVGLGAVPAFIALWFRLTIIESPRYTAEVTKDSLQAVNDVSQFYQRVSIDSASVNSVEPPSPESGSFRLSATQSVDHQPDRPASAAPFAEQDAASPLAILNDFKHFFGQKDNFRKLAATSLCWFCLDLPFYGLGLISPRITRIIWFGSKLPRTSLYQLLFQTAYQSTVVVSSGAVVGNLLSILTIDKLGRRNIQLNGFFWLFLLNVVIGASFQHLIFFNFGPNTTTYMLPAELFPTRFRCTCHGIAAAFGKLGSVLAQCFLAYVDFGNGADYTNVPDWLGYALLCLSFFMLMGLLITYFFIPDVRDKDGRTKSLEELTDGMMPGDEFSRAVANGHPLMPLLIIVEAIGYLCRYISAKQTPKWTTKPYIGQSLLLLLAPALFAASVYMILGRIIRLLNAGSLSLVRPNWLTKVFVAGDVISFFMQCGGGGLLAGAKTQDKVNMGEHMIIAGLFVQILFFGFFMLVSVIFHRRMLATPIHHMMSTQLPWNYYMKILYTVSVLIMIRSVYRVAEYVQGSDGYLQSKEAFIYVFDAALMFACCVILNVSHPSKLLSHSQADQKVDSDLEMLNPER